MFRDNAIVDIQGTTGETAANTFTATAIDVSDYVDLNENNVIGIKRVFFYVTLPEDDPSDVGIANRTWSQMTLSEVTETAIKGYGDENTIATILSELQQHEVGTMANAGQFTKNSECKLVREWEDQNLFIVIRDTMSIAIESTNATETASGEYVIEFYPLKVSESDALQLLKQAFSAL